MRSFKKNLRYITHLIFFLWANTAVFSTSEHLMLPDTGEVPQKLVKYYEEKWKQKYRLQKTSPFNRGFLRFVRSSDQLFVGYGVLPDSGIEIPKLDLPDSRYKDLSKIGMFVKVFLGYLTNSDSELRSFTPERINVLVPCVSSIIQWKSGMAPKLVPTGFLRREQNGPIVVLLSGVQGKKYQEKISKFYNCIYKETEDTPIEVLSADDVADMYIPYLLNGMVEAKGIEPFTMKYLGAEVIEKKLKKTFCYVQEVKTDHQRTQNVISCTLEFLKLLIQNQDCISRHDTVSRLCNDYLEGGDALPSKDKEADFRKFVQKYKQELMKAAFDRMKDEKNKLEQMHLQVLEATTFSQISNELQTLSQQLIEYNKWRQYLMYCLYPSSYLNTLEKAQSLWGLIHELKDELQCTNPNGGCSIDAVKRLYKACYPSNDNLNHTERLLMGFFKAKPQSLLGDLKEQFEKKKSSNPPLVVEAGFPKYLGIIADSFSWLDICKSCADFLHTNPIWESALQDVRSFIEAEGFTVPFPKINGMFRFVSQDHYPVADNSYNGSVPPLDLADAGGGADYRDSGWDFRLLSEERISLVTRYSPRDTLIRDQVIEGIQNRLMILQAFTGQTEDKRKFDIDNFVQKLKVFYNSRLNGVFGDYKRPLYIQKCLSMPVHGFDSVQNKHALFSEYEKNFP